MGENETENLAQYEASLHPYARMLRQAVVNQDKEALRNFVRTLCDNLNEDAGFAPPINDFEIDEILTNGQAHFPVRTGTHEDRITIAFGPPHAEPGKGRIFMPPINLRNPSLGKIARRKFHDLFGMSDEEDYKEF